MMDDPRLPAFARAQLIAIAEVAQNSETLARSALAAIVAVEERRVAAKNRAASSPDLAPEVDRELEALDREVERLRAVAAARFAHAGSYKQTLAQIRDWLIRRVEKRASFELAPRVSAPASYAGPAGIARIRAEIAAASAELETVRVAPLPAGELRAKARDLVSALAERGRPTIGIERGAFDVGWRRPGSNIPGTTPEDVAAFTAWLFRDALLAALEREIDSALPSDAAYASGEGRLAEVMFRVKS